MAGMGERIMRCGTTHAVARSVSAPAPGCALEECACTGDCVDDGSSLVAACPVREHVLHACMQRP